MNWIINILKKIDTYSQILLTAEHYFCWQFFDKKNCGKMSSIIPIYDITIDKKRIINVANIIFLSFSKEAILIKAWEINL